MQLKGKSAHMAENLLKYAILGGLRNEIRQVVMMHQIDTIEDIKRWGLVAESMNKNFKGVETTELAKAMVAEMREHMKEDQSAAVFIQKNQQQPDDTSTRENTRQAVFNQQQSVRSRAINNGNQEDQEYTTDQQTDGFNRGGFNRGGFNRGGFSRGGFNRGGRFNNRGNRSWGQQPPMDTQQQSGGTNFYNRQFTNNSDFNNTFYNVVLPDRCGRCGGFNHGQRTCPALNGSRCTFCNRPGHWRAVCRTRALQEQQGPQ